MCPRGLGKMKRPRGFMRMETVELLLNHFHPSQQLVRVHHFGEAILHPEIHTILNMLGTKGLTTVLSLNPATLTPELIQKILSSKVNIVCFSLDGFSDKNLRDIRGIQCGFNKCWEMIEQLIQESRNQSQFILKVIQMVRLNANLQDIDRFNRIKEIYPEPDVHLYLAENIGFGDLSLVEQTLTNGNDRIQKTASPCAAPFSEISVLWNGDVVLCCYDYDGFQVIGNIHEQSISDIWYGEMVQSIRELFKSRKTESLPLCGSCFMAPHHFLRIKSLKTKVWKEEQEILSIYTQAKKRT